MFTNSSYLYLVTAGLLGVPASVGHAQKLRSLTNFWLTYRLLEMLRPLLAFLFFVNEMALGFIQYIGLLV